MHKPVLKLFLILIFIISSSLPVFPALADDSVLGITPEGVYPIGHPEIMMKDEEITIEIAEDSSAKVSCRFVFRNRGTAQSVLMGFPAQLYAEVSEFSPQEALELRNFTARDGNEEIPVTLSDTIPDPPRNTYSNLVKYSKWYTFSVNFQESEEKTLYHSYEIAFPHDSIGEVFMGYVLETGASWAGPVGHAKIVFDMGNNPMVTLTDLYPNNFFRIEGNRLIWERSDFEPEYNLGVIRNASHYTDEYLEYFKDNGYNEDYEKAKEKIAFFGISPETIRKNAAEYYRMYDALVIDDPVKALYIKSVLRLPDGDAKPGILECGIWRHEGNTWYFVIKGTDPDGDLVAFQEEITGIGSYKYFEDQGGRLSFDALNHVFIGGGYLETSETGPFAINFTITDAAGNSDTETLLLQTEQPLQASGEKPLPISSPTSGQVPAKSSEPQPAGESAPGSSGHGASTDKAAANFGEETATPGFDKSIVTAVIIAIDILAGLVVLKLIIARKKR